MKFYDSSKKQEIEFIPRVKDEVSMYVCGPTVYDHPHLGHARTACNFDTIRRIFQLLGFKVNYVSNITDIEDKIINRAKEEGRTEVEVSKEFELSYFNILGNLNVLDATHTPHATDFVQQMIDFILKLEENNFAYVTSSGVYFRVSKKDDYGILSGRNIEQLLESAGTRVEVDEEKESPLDFALWKFAKEGEPTWPSPWGDGRPGWHIECSAMSHHYLGEDFDIHGGGADLIFPHHENERALTEGAGYRFVNYWMHSEMLNLEGKKMAKSQKHFVSLQDGLDSYGPAVLRMSFLLTHYREVMEYSDVTLSNAKAGLDRIKSCLRRGKEFIDHEVIVDNNEIISTCFQTGLNDFNTPKIVSEIFELVRKINQKLDNKDLENLSKEYSILINSLEVLGIASEWLFDQSIDDATIENLVSDREEARKQKDFIKADEIRDTLLEMNVILEDGPDGVVWRINE